ncbi:MAG: (2Fe-2S)-binding protein [Proteobacteria bacterium]|nr:(2Fe-2S)-binding protein [Pseudomonadota bacterium]
MRRRCEDDRESITIMVDGRPLVARAGDSVAVALGLNDILKMRSSPAAGAPRGAFCFMGVCQECAIYIDGALRQACLTRVAEGMVVELRGVP